jgi:hypothetical protein
VGEGNPAEPATGQEADPAKETAQVDADRLAADRANAESIGNEISQGHAFDKHVVERGEFPGVTTREQFAGVIGDTVTNGESRALSGGRTAYWSDGTVVIRDPGTADGGTAFRPTSGYDYFQGLH